MYRGAPLSAANVPLRDVAVLRCRTLIEISGSNGLSNQVRADFWQTSSNLAGTSTAKPHGMPESGKRAAPMCRGAPLSHLDRKIKRNGPGSQV